MDNDLDNQILTEMRAGFNRVDNRIESLRDLLKSDMSGVHKRFERLESDMSGVHKRFERLESEMSGVHKRFERLESDMSGVHNRIESLRDLLKSEMSGVYKRFERLESEMRHGFAAQKKATDDVIENFLSDEFPEKFKAYLKSR